MGKAVEYLRDVSMTGLTPEDRTDNIDNIRLSLRYYHILMCMYDKKMVFLKGYVRTS